MGPLPKNIVGDAASILQLLFAAPLAANTVYFIFRKPIPLGVTCTRMGVTAQCLLDLVLEYYLQALPKRLMLKVTNFENLEGKYE